MPTIHPRVAIVNRAGARIREAVDTILDELGDEDQLTYLELLGILHELQGSWLKYALRAERHPDDPGRPSGLE